VHLGSLKVKRRREKVKLRSAARFQFIASRSFEQADKRSHLRLVNQKSPWRKIRIPRRQAFKQHVWWRIQEIQPAVRTMFRGTRAKILTLATRPHSEIQDDVYSE